MAACDVWGGAACDDARRASVFVCGVTAAADPADAGIVFARDWEFQAWQFALRHMRRVGVPVTAAVERRVELSMQYAVGKAMRRGVPVLPAPLHRYTRAA